MEEEIRVPVKGRGVPREAPGGTFVAELYRALEGAVVPAELERRARESGFYEAGLLAQFDLLAGCVEALLPVEEALPLLEGAGDERVRALAPALVRRRWLEDLPEAVRHLRRQCALPGTTVQEFSQVALKAVIQRHGLAASLPMLDDWLDDPQPEVRRCLVEALRPRGVWTAHLTELRRDPEPLHPLLARVLDDPSLYVRKAAANCLNDVARDHPEAAVRWTSEWLLLPLPLGEGWGGGPMPPGEPAGAGCPLGAGRRLRVAGGGLGGGRGAGQTAERRWVIARGLRTLIRAGHPEAQRLLGLEAPDSVTVEWTSPLPERVRLNQVLTVEARLRNDGDAPVRVRVQGELSGPGKGDRPRVRRYLIGEASVAPGAEARVTGRVHFVDFTTQPKLPGHYTLTLLANGAPVETRGFEYSGPEGGHDAGALSEPAR